MTDTKKMCLRKKIKLYNYVLRVLSTIATFLLCAILHNSFIDLIGFLHKFHSFSKKCKKKN